MNRTSLALAAAATIAAGAALADSPRPVEPSAPQSVAAARDAGSGTVAGTASEVAAHGFMLDDGSEKIWVDTGKHAAHSVEPGEEATVVGTVKRDEIDAQQVIRSDGSLTARAAANERQESRRHKHDRD